MPIPSNLWRKNNGTPSALLSTDRDATGLPWDNLINNEEGRLACGWEPAPDYPDYNPQTEMPVWVDDEWVIEQLPAPPPQVVKVSKMDFARLFTNNEKASINAAKAKIRQMTDADYANPLFTNLVMLELVFNAFEYPLEYIELTHPDTLQGINVLALAGILAPERVAEVLSNTIPN
jgi:hypothetical protein